ncbi:MAG: TolC family protein [Pirellulaceae bacterium]|nr:TolC family protein [Pirellulaceae bacterium]
MVKLLAIGHIYVNAYRASSLAVKINTHWRIACCAGRRCASRRWLPLFRGLVASWATLGVVVADTGLFTKVTQLSKSEAQATGIPPQTSELGVDNSVLLSPPAGANFDGETIPLVPESFDFTVVASPSIKLGDSLASDVGTTQSLGDTLSEAALCPPESQLRQPWWHASLALNRAENGRVTDLAELVWQAVSHSPNIQAILLEPQILDARAAKELGEFDVNSFVDSIFRDTSDPVGNTLTTGGPPRLNESLWENRAGIRNKNQHGGRTEFFQEFLTKDNNSRFFDPREQADSRMVLRYTQPLMRGRGLTYNRASFVVATITANQGKYQASLALQDHTFQLTTAYWDLYAAQGEMLQIERGIENLQLLYQQLQGRSEIDSLRSQVLRAEAAIHKQTAALAQAQARWTIAQANLKAAVAAPDLLCSADYIVPIAPVVTCPSNIDLQHERLQALEQQPKIQEARQAVRSVRTRLHVAENELKPTLNLVMEGYLRGLSGDYDVIESLGDQFTKTPSYHAGVAYQRPRRNIAAQSILHERRMELRKSLLQLDNILLSVSADVEGAVAMVQSAYQQLDSAVRSTLATEAEVQYLDAIWRDAFLGGARTTSLQLDQLLNAHIQLISSENNWIRAEQDYMLAHARLQLVTGSLLPCLTAADAVHSN